MKSVTALMAAASMAMIVPAGASAAAATHASPNAIAAAPQHRQRISRREAKLRSRITMGVRNGALTRAEASRLRTRLANLRRLEWRYRRHGLTRWERSNLNRRFDALSRSVRAQRHDRQRRRYWSRGRWHWRR